MSADMHTVPVIREPGFGEGAGYLFSFGAYGNTHVAVLGGSLEDGLESCFEWLDDNAPGLLTRVDYEGAARDLGIECPSTEGELYAVAERAETDMTICGHTTLRHGDAIPSWEWTVRDLRGWEIETLLDRFCPDCEREIKGTTCLECAIG